MPIYGIIQTAIDTESPWCTLHYLLLITDFIPSLQTPVVNIEIPSIQNHFTTGLGISDPATDTKLL